MAYFACVLCVLHVVDTSKMAPGHLKKCMLILRNDLHGDEKNVKKECVPCMHGLFLFIF